MGNMQIQYPNNTERFALGVDTGLKLGSVMGRNDNSGAVPIGDPGERKRTGMMSAEDTSKLKNYESIVQKEQAEYQLTPREQASLAKYEDLVANKPDVRISDFTQQELADVKRAKELEKRMAGMGDYDQWSVRQTALNEIQSPITKAAVANGIKSKELEDLMRPIINQTPDASSALATLKIKLGTEGAKAIDAKMAEIQGAQKQLDVQWSIGAKDALMNLLENPQHYRGKNGQFHPTYEKVAMNEANIIRELYPIDPQWVNEYLSKRTGRTGGGGGKPDVYKDMATGELLNPAQAFERSRQSGSDVVKLGSTDPSMYEGRGIKADIDIQKLTSDYTKDPTPQKRAALASAFTKKGWTPIFRGEESWTDIISGTLTGTRQPLLMAKDKNGNVIGFDDAGQFNVKTNKPNKSSSDRKKIGNVEYSESEVQTNSSGIRAIKRGDKWIRVP